MASLVAHAGALGDFITCLPAMDAWRLLHAGTPLILFGKPAYAALAAAPGFDEVWDIESSRFAPLFGTDPLSEGMASGLRDVSSALLFSTAASPLMATLRGGGVKEMVRQDPFPSARVPIIDYHLSLFPPDIVARVESIPRLARTAGIESSSGIIALHAGSGSPRKNWPLHAFIALARELERRGGTIAWILGPSEHRFALPPGSLLWKEPELPRLAARLAQCRCYIGNDSGVTHLAAAVGCPTIALFGASDAKVWAPRGKLVTVVSSSSNGMENLPVEKVLEVMKDL